MHVIGSMGAILIWGGLSTGMEFTARTGTTVGCADCHVASSKEALDYARNLTQKVFASKDATGQIVRTIDTPG